MKTNYLKEEKLVRWIGLLCLAPTLVWGTACGGYGEEPEKEEKVILAKEENPDQKPVLLDSTPERATVAVSKAGVQPTVEDFGLDSEEPAGICDPDTPSWCVTGDAAAACSPDGSTVEISFCDDHDACTSDYCYAGECWSVNVAPKCDDGNPCTDDGCDAVSGCWSVVNESPCDDSDLCTDGDTCRNGHCASGQPICECESDDACEALTKTKCDVVACIQDVCVRLGAVACEAPDAECESAACDPATGHCLQSAVEDGACDDGNACTTDDICHKGGVCSGDETSCDDANPCTQDSCDPAVGCIFHPTIGAPCSTGNGCRTAGVCKLFLGALPYCKEETVICPGPDDGSTCCIPMFGCVASDLCAAQGWWP